MKKEEEEEQKNKQDGTPFDPDEVIEWMINKERAPINNELFKKHFKVQNPIVMYKVLYETKDNEKNSKLVDIFNSGLKDLEEEFKKMSVKERITEKPYNIVKVVNRILEFNGQYQQNQQNQQNQQGEGLKILTPNRMLSRLPITFFSIKSRK